MNYTSSRLNQRLMELKIKDFKDNITSEQLDELYSRTFKIQESIPEEKP